jgi:hypothetical protein
MYREHVHWARLVHNVHVVRSGFSSTYEFRNNKLMNPAELQAHTEPESASDERSPDVSYLYPKLMGAAWDSLHPNIRQAHYGGKPVTLTGSLRLKHGSSRLARLLLRLLSVPLVPGPLPVELRITERDGVETWHRTVGDHSFVTMQSQCNSLLCERIGLMEFRFQLKAAGNWLHYDQVECRLFGMRLPRKLSPYVWALEKRGESENSTHIRVQVLSPVAGFLFEYEGYLFYQEDAA